MSQTSRRHVYLPDRVIDNLRGFPLSARLVDVVDRYTEMVKRSSVPSAFDDDEWRILVDALGQARLHPREIINGGIVSEIETYGKLTGANVKSIVRWLKNASVADRISLIDLVERHLAGDGE